MNYLRISQFIIVSLFINLAIASTPRDLYTIKVDGLGCPFCAYGLEKKFKDFKSIKDTKIEMETGVFTFSYPSEQVLSISQVEQKVKDAGYTPVYTKIKRANGEVENSVKPVN